VKKKKKEDRLSSREVSRRKKRMCRMERKGNKALARVRNDIRICYPFANQIILTQLKKGNKLPYHIGASNKKLK
jgi:hypothetical protein